MAVYSKQLLLIFIIHIYLHISEGKCIRYSEIYTIININLIIQKLNELLFIIIQFILNNNLLFNYNIIILNNNSSNLTKIIYYKK
jgi:hypothetical protein